MRCALLTTFGLWVPRRCGAVVGLRSVDGLRRVGDLWSVIAVGLKRTYTPLEFNFGVGEGLLRSEIVEGEAAEEVV